MKINENLLKKITKNGTAFILAGTLLAGNTKGFVNQAIFTDTVYAKAEEDIQETTDLSVQMGINLYMDDKCFIPVDVNGNETYPFISDGTTYVPIRAIASLFNANIKWDAKEKKVSIITTGDIPKIKHTIKENQYSYTTNVLATTGAKLYVNNQLVVPTDANGNVKNIYNINGTIYVPVRAVSQALGLPIAWSDVSKSVFIGKHKSEGLTVENINNAEEFLKHIDTFAADREYCWYGKKIVLPDGSLEFPALSSYKIFGILACILNREYCTNETLQYFFANSSALYNGEQLPERLFNEMPLVWTALTSDTFEGYESGQHKWKSGLIDEELAIFLEDYQKLYYDCYHSGEFDKLLNMVDNYLDGNLPTINYGERSPFADFIVVYGALYVYLQNLYIYDIDKYREYYYCYEESKSRCTDEIESLKQIIYPNQLVK